MPRIHLFLIIILFNIYFQKKIRFLESVLKGTDDCKNKSFPPTEENVKFVGRVYQEEGVTWLVQSGSSIEFYITGSTVEVVLVGDNHIYFNKSQRPRFGIFVDDELFLDSTMSELELKVELFKVEDEEKRVKVKIMLLSENNNGGIGVKSANTYICSNQKAIEPVEKKKINIEFIGDSITCAYGVEAKNQNGSFKTTTENASKSYAYLASQILDADYSIVCYSGAGIVSGYTAKGEKNLNLLPPYYKNISRKTKYPGEFNFTEHKYDVILINLGTNDNNYVKADPSTRNDEFIQEYVNFLGTVREANPDSWIICTIGTLECGEVYSLIEKAIKLFGDSRVKSFLSPSQDLNDGVGANWHPSVITHQKLSKLVAEKISEVLT